MASHHVVEPLLIFENLSSPSYSHYAMHYYRCVQCFRAEHSTFSPVPYALLCRAIELELKSRHLEDAHLPGGPTLEDMRRDYGHDLASLYADLPPSQKILNSEELTVLSAANAIYDRGKGFDYVAVTESTTGFSRFPNLAVLDAVTRKLLGLSVARCQK